MKFLSIAILSLGLLCGSVYADTATDAGTQFLTVNKAKAGVTTLPDGLQYKVIKEGKGAKPSADDTVTVDYTGTLIDGTVFDSSAKHGQPMTFPVKDVIPGWTEALQLMKVGSTWEIYVPASLAYGAAGAPPVIGPNETLVFKITLREVKKY
jgi:FKBP-type peptidyl-prolyl cis-trans isomerase FklB